MHAKFDLDLSLEDDRHDFKLYSNAGNMAAMLNDYDNWLRNKIKWGDMDEQRYEVFEEVRAKFNELLEENGVSDIVG